MDAANGRRRRALSRDGDSEALRALVDRHSRAVYRLAYRLTGTPQDAEDVVQETFLKAYKQLGRFELRANFCTWLHQADVAWIGYAVPVSDREQVMCCFNSGTTFINGTMSSASGCCGACALESSQAGTNITPRNQTPSPSGVVKLEGADTMNVLFRIVERTVERIRVFSEDCRLDLGGRPLRWLKNAPHHCRALKRQSRGAQAGDVLAGTIQGSTRDRVLRRRPSQVAGEFLSSDQ